MHTWVSVRGCVRVWEGVVWWTQAKHMIMLKDSVMEDVLKFLDHCEGQQAISDPAS